MKIEIGSKEKSYIRLPRGGFLIETSVGYMQIGSPPETIKDTMILERSTPQIFILPNDFFHVEKGISVAELEFPIYFNHFLRKKKTYIVCTPKQREQLKVVLQQAVFGPEVIDLHSEYIDGENTPGYPDMKAEMNYFRGARTLDDLVHFVIYDKKNCVRFNNVTLEKSVSGDFLIDDRDWDRRTKIPGWVDFKIIYDTGKAPLEPYSPPLLGITCLGPSHGFDVEDNTSGFLLWVQHKGIMVDPPVNSTEWLRESNVNPKLIDTIILTHTHADHDAGTFQKILEEDRITIYSTETVMHSFITKYNALTNIPVKELFSLFDFVPVVIGRSYIIHGAEFRFNYSLHSIPTLAFEFVYLDQSFIYSSDHLNDPERYEEMYKKGVLTESRYKDLLNFPWHHKIIYHEAGIPPLHTRIEYLRSLPEDLQKKTTIYHIARKDIPPDTILTLAKFGIENTLYPTVTPPPHEEAVRLLDVLAKVELFRDFPISKAKDFIVISEEEHFKKGDLIIRKDTMGDKFFIIISGNVRVEGIEVEDDYSHVDSKQYGNYEYFGEASLVLDQPRSASVIAETDVTALTIEKNRFLNFIKGSDLSQKLTRLHDVRRTGTWDVFSISRFLQGVTSAQKTYLELIMRPAQFPENHVLIEQGKVFDSAYIIKSGAVNVLKDNEEVEVMSRGDFCGEIYMLQKNSPSSFTFRAMTEIECYQISQEDMMRYIADNPGIYMRLNYIYGG